MFRFQHIIFQVHLQFIHHNVYTLYQKSEEALFILTWFIY
jgi:hypothetical protein